MTDLDRLAAEALGFERRADHWEAPSGEVYWTGEGVNLDSEKWKPSSDLNQAALVVQEVQRRGLGVAWLHEMEASCPILGNNNRDEWEFWLANAPAEARVRAAVEVLKGGSYG